MSRMSGASALAVSLNDSGNVVLDRAPPERIFVFSHHEPTRLKSPTESQDMCGITAVLSRRSSIDANTMRAGMRSLHHRGPDGQQHWISHDCRAALGHTRLSIIDLTTGDQPISNED